MGDVAAQNVFDDTICHGAPPFESLYGVGPGWRTVSRVADKKERPDANATVIGAVLIALGLSLALFVDSGESGLSILVGAGMAIAGLIVVLRDAFAGRPSDRR